MASLLYKRVLIAALLLACIWPVALPATTNAQTVTSPPEFSAQRGFYDAAFNLNLSSAGGAAIRYTLNGSTPSATVGTIYTCLLYTSITGQVTM